ncbi:MAG: FKBP-type peptidyl-prolyl cis-trans isomerase [Verrucomicrobia bacterium]|nr:FKBP-type peptidyl-prolyl cis-trans isomerase [Verrucomicrobiota bacterium]
MKRSLTIFSFGALPLFGAQEVISVEPATIAPLVKAAEHDMTKISRAFGHLMGQHLETLGLEFDMPSVIQGIQDRLNGIAAPMSETECLQALGQIQEIAFQTQCHENLKKAEDFLKQNKNEPGVVELEAGKLQYVRLAEGKGSIVEEHFCPLIRYCGKFLDGKVFGQSQEDDVLSLDDTIEGFKKSIVGMREGEKRRIFIHPELGYGQSTGFLPPNSLLTFEIEVIKANTPKADDSTLGKGPHANELSQVDAPITATK